MKKRMHLMFVLFALIPFIFSCASNEIQGNHYKYTEQNVLITAPAKDGISDHTIPGILTLPIDPNGKIKFPSMVMLHGTGSNKNEAGGGYDKAAPLMAECGIASLRIDFMGNGDSEASYTEYCYTSANNDAKAAADYLKSLESIDQSKIGVMGWSQGGTNALLAAVTYPETFSKVITWSGATELDRCDGVFKDFDASYTDAKENGSTEMTFDWRSSLQTGKRWFDEVKDTDIIKEVSKIKCPVLAINGDLDTTVPMENAVKISKAAKKGSLYIVKGADHTYNVFTGDFSAIQEATLAGVSFIFK